MVAFKTGTGKCKDCGATVYFAKSKKDRWLPPLDHSGDPHFHTCPEAPVTMKRKTLMEHTRNTWITAFRLGLEKAKPRKPNWRPPW